jgi:hypothetical protein
MVTKSGMHNAARNSVGCSAYERPLTRESPYIVHLLISNSHQSDTHLDLLGLVAKLPEQLNADGVVVGGCGHVIAAAAAICHRRQLDNNDGEVAKGTRLQHLHLQRAGDVRDDGSISNTADSYQYNILSYAF